MRRLSSAPRSFAGLAAAVFALACLSTASVADAQTAAPFTGAEPVPAPPLDPRIEEARKLFKIGVELLQREQFSEALAMFERSARLHPHGMTIYDIGYCERALVHFTRARKSFLEALARRQELTPDVIVDTEAYVAEMDRRLARVTITLRRGDLSLAVDGRPLEARPGGELVAGTRDAGPPERLGATSFTLVLDPGIHTFVVAVPSAPDMALTRELAVGATSAITLGPEDGPRPMSPLRIGGAVSLGVAGVSAVVGAVLGGLAIAKKSTLAERCFLKQCAPVEEPTIASMRAFANGSTAGFAIATAGLAVGLGLMLAPDARAPASRAPAASITLRVTPFGGRHGSF
jgi:hypothetical protein